MILSSSYQTLPDAAQAGGKGYHLLRLKQAGFPVPEFIILPVSFFDGADAATIQTRTGDCLPEIMSRFPVGTLFAVRSSATVEDNISHSFAGQFKTLLEVPSSDIPGAVLQVLESVRHPNVIAYLKHMDIQHTDMAVIIQQMIPADISGVAFGMNPLDGNTAERVINATKGLGEALVSGQVSGERYTMRDGNLLQSGNTSTLLQAWQFQEINKVLGDAEALFGSKQDIEFAYKDDTFYLLQSRPVSTAGKKEQKITWDNSNIIESYPGMSSALTFSFIEKMYGAVYRQLSAVLGISKKKINTYSHVYDNMLGLLNGRVYYNLNSWFKALSLLPGYKLNAAFMEKMMGVKEKPDIDVSEGEPRGKTLSDYLDVLKAIVYIVYNAATVRKQKRLFVRDFEDIYQRFSQKDYSSATAQEIWNDYLSFEKMMVSKWEAPLVNDFFAMIYFGVLQKLCAAYVPGQADLHNRLVATSKDIITTEPIRLIPQIVDTIRQDEQLKQAFETQSPEAIWQLLQEPAHQTSLKAIHDYLAVWGERCFAELKLETVTYTQQPGLFIAVLIPYLKEGVHYRPKAENNDAEAARLSVLRALAGKPLKKRIFSHVLKQSRYLIANRENLRFYRTKGFGMVRRMMLALGSSLQRDGILQRERDIFFLRLHEVANISAGKTSGTEAKEIIRRRKEDEALFEDMPLPERVITWGKQELILSQSNGKPTSGGQQDTFQGIPCCAGVVRARVCKVQAAGDSFRSQQILTTYATDPGYVVLFPAASGILTERGSLLSHAAIVSREMGIPCIVGIEGLMTQLEDGTEVLMDGSTGMVKIIKTTTLHEQAGGNG